MDAEIAHFILHAFVFDPDLDDIDMLEAAFLDCFIHLAEQQGRPTHAAIFFHQAHPIDIEPFCPPEFNKHPAPSQTAATWPPVR